MAYTKDTTQAIVAAYTKAMENGVDTVDAVKTVAKEQGKTVAAIRSKLVAEKVYVPKAPVQTAAKTVVRKASLVKNIQTKTGLSNLDSLEKANKDTLEALLKFITGDVNEAN